MTTSTGIPKRVEEVLTIHRRGFLKSAGLLVVNFATGAGALITEADAQSSRATQGAAPYPDPDFRQLDSWIVIHENNTATFYVGKTDCGQGTGTSFRQLMSDELDIAFDLRQYAGAWPINDRDWHGQNLEDALCRHSRSLELCVLLAEISNWIEEAVDVQNECYQHADFQLMP